jgi:phosphoenolpyruvate carboxykinase (ATP)
VTEPQATFSTCFGAPFMPLHPTVSGDLLRDLVGRHHVDCWLVNTGWTGGSYGVGRRMPIRVTRRLLSAVLDGTLNKMHFHIEGSFGLAVPSSAPGVESDLLNPIKTWASKDDYEATAKKLVEMFRANFVKFEPHVDTDVKDAALHGAGGA